MGWGAVVVGTEKEWARCQGGIVVVGSGDTWAPIRVRETFVFRG